MDWVLTVSPEDQTATCFSGEGTETGVNVTPPATDTCAEKVVGDPGDATGGGQGATTVDQGLTLKKTGTYTVTFCADLNNSGTCDTGEPTVTGTKTVKAGPPTQDRVRFAADATPPSQCNTGQTQQSFPSNSGVDVVQCVFDANNNPVPSQTGLQWSITGPGDFASTGTTTDANGQAHATVENGTPGQQTSVTSCVDTDGNGTCNFSGNTVIINWTAPPQGADTLSLRYSKHRTGPHEGRVTFSGELVGDSSGACFGHEGGTLVQIHRGTATGPVVKSATTSAGGAYRAGLRLHLGANHVRHFTATTQGNPSCVAATSKTIKVRGFR